MREIKIYTKCFELDTFVNGERDTTKVDEWLNGFDRKTGSEPRIEGYNYSKGTLVISIARLEDKEEV